MRLYSVFGYSATRYTTSEGKALDKRNGFFRWHRAAILGALAALVLVVPAAAGGAQVTRGEFHEFSLNTSVTSADMP